MRSSLRHLKLPGLSVLLVLSSLTVRAQLLPAEDFFNRGAQSYISNNIPDALSQVEMGLKTYPGDEKLKKLEELLKQKQQQQQQNQQNQNQKNQSQSQKSDDKKDQQQKQDQKKSDDQKKQDDEKKDQSGQKPEDQKKDGDQPQPDKPDDKKGDQNAEAQAAKPGQMKPEEAKHLLDAQKGNEQVLQMKPKDKPQDPLRPVKDW